MTSERAGGLPSEEAIQAALNGYTPDTHIVRHLHAEAEHLREWAENAYEFIRSSVVIGKRSCRDGDHLDYGWADRLLGEGQNLRVDPTSVISDALSRARAQAASSDLGPEVATDAEARGQ